jgi:aminoglycoside phosphotransferase family enzyme
MDYAMWDSLKENVYLGVTQTLEERELKNKIVACWGDITLDEVRKSILVGKNGCA